MVNLGFIGTGFMGSSIIKGLVASEYAKNIQVFAYDADMKKVEALAGVSPLSSAKAIVDTCKYVLLAVKPQIAGEVLEGIKEKVTSETVIISICAGVSIDFIRSHTVKNVKVVLVMPNAPVSLGEGAAALSRDLLTSDEEFQVVLNVMRSSGIAEEISPDKMNEIICINGSSPAFIYLFSKFFIDYAKENGIDEAVAMELFAKSLIGSAKMMEKSGKTLDEMIKNVATPGGTTEAGLKGLYENGFEAAIKAACTLCTNRASTIAHNMQ